MNCLSVRISSTLNNGGTWLNLIAMTKVEITIQNGRITWVEQSGDELPNDKWENLNMAVANVFND